MIKAIVFDFDNTLGDRTQYAYACYKDLFKKICCGKSPLEIESLVQEAMLRDQDGDVNKVYVQEKLEEVGVVFPFDNLNTYWEENLYRFVVPMDDAKDTLSYLQEKYTLGILSNGGSIAQKKKIEASGLQSFFNPEHIFVSGDYGIHKPDPRLFQLVVKTMGFEVDEVAYVGDLFHRDVLGAYKAGLKPVWISLHDTPMEEDILRIHRLRELKNHF